MSFPESSVGKGRPRCRQAGCWGVASSVPCGLQGGSWKSSAWHLGPALPSPPGLEWVDRCQSLSGKSREEQWIREGRGSAQGLL